MGRREPWARWTIALGLGVRVALNVGFATTSGADSFRQRSRHRRCHPPRRELVSLPDEITRLLVRAVMIDLLRQPNIAKSNTPYTALAMALEYGLAARVGELRLLRWGCLDRDEHHILIPGPKNPNALRWMVVFDPV
jgi:integrase